MYFYGNLRQADTKSNEHIYETNSIYIGSRLDSDSQDALIGDAPDSRLSTMAYVEIS